MSHHLNSDTEDFLVFVVRDEFTRLTKERHDKKIFNTQVLFVIIPKKTIYIKKNILGCVCEKSSKS